MAKDTSKSLRSSVIYSVYVRNHSEEGTFRAVISDLDRIKALGTDIIWFMPIHPIGVKNKKGSLGCPYANRDYRSTNPEYGSMEDFKLLVDEIHKRGMKCMIDVVYNHTSPDSVLTEEHPEFFYRRADGSMGNRVGDWTDVVDLDYNCRELWDYQIESLKMWAGIVDGFRCDVASFIPAEFWCRARAEVEKIHPGFIWLAETVHSGFGQFIRKSGMYCGSDSEMFDAFDIEYEYDVREVFDRYIEGRGGKLSSYMDVLNFQECAYPDNYNKLRFLENHDLPRICSFVKDPLALENLTAFMYFVKGTTLVYAGQEYANDHLPSLFDKDVFSRDESRDISAWFTRFAQMKSALSDEDHFKGEADDERDIAILKRDDNRSFKLGVFSLKGKSAEVKTSLPDGEYTNLLGGTAQVCGGKLICTGKPVVIKVESKEELWQ